MTSSGFRSGTCNLRTMNSSSPGLILPVDGTPVDGIEEKPTKRVLRCAFMLPGHRAPWGFSLLAGLLIAGFSIQGFLASRIKSPAFDETGDIAAGLSYLQTGEVRANLQHPPLLKELAGISL